MKRKSYLSVLAGVVVSVLAATNYLLSIKQQCNGSYVVDCIVVELGSFLRLPANSGSPPGQPARATVEKYWEAPSGEVVELQQNGNSIDLVFRKLPPSMTAEGYRLGTSYFRGERTGDKIEGTNFVIGKAQPAAPPRACAWPVQATVLLSGDTLTLKSDRQFRTECGVPMLVESTQVVLKAARGFRP